MLSQLLTCATDAFPEARTRKEHSQSFGGHNYSHVLNANTHGGDFDVIIVSLICHVSCVMCHVS